MDQTSSSLSTPLPDDHPDRRPLADEVHARPPEALATPSRATHIAVVVSPNQRSEELAHLAELCRHFAVAPPANDAAHFVANLESVRLKWERHGEFSSYTFFQQGPTARLFGQPPVSMLPEGWVSRMPGATMFAGNAELLSIKDQEPTPDFLAAYLDANTITGSSVGGGAGLAFADFQIQPDGFSRFLVFDRTLTPRQAGRTLQRLFEIETYRMMAMLSLPVAREQTKKLSAVEAALVGLTAGIAHQSVVDETLLQQLTELAAEVESGLASSQFRFGACKAYSDLVVRRIAELREQRLPGVQTIEEFMVRRFTPAVATCASTAQRLHNLSERVAQASALLSTRVDIAREKQNHKLLDSMDRRAQLQLSLQETVELVSVIPITYYVVALIAYLLKASKTAGLHVDPELATATAIPIVALLVIWAIRRAHHRIMGAAKGD